MIPACLQITLLPSPSWEMGAWKAGPSQQLRANPPGTEEEASENQPTASALLDKGSDSQHVPKLFGDHSWSRTDLDKRRGGGSLACAGSDKSQFQKHSCALSSDGGLCSLRLSWNWVADQEKTRLPCFFLTSVGVSTGIRRKRSKTKGTSSESTISTKDGGLQA